MLLLRRARLPPGLARHASFSTLTPLRLLASDWLDTSGKSKQRIRYGPRNAPGTIGNIQFRYPDRAARPADVLHDPRFPTGAAGFLYAHAVPGHPAAGAVRMRLVPTPDPARFAAGTDLLLASGLPWSMPFPALARAKTHAPLRMCLLREGTVREADMDRWTRAPVDAGAQVVYERGAPFFVDFARSRCLPLHIVRGADVERLLIKQFATTQTGGESIPLWSGAAHVALEYQTSAHAFALRVLRTIRPFVPNPDHPAGLSRCHMLPPAEGQLLMRWRGAADAPQPFLLRTPIHQALSLLLSPEELMAAERDLEMKGERQNAGP